MARLSYDSVEALIYDPVSANRTATRAALYTLGFRRTETVPTLEVDGRMRSRNSRPTSCWPRRRAPPTNSACAIQQLRQGAAGHNPFIVIIVTAWEKNVPLITKVVNSGADDLLLRPFLDRAAGRPHRRRISNGARVLSSPPIMSAPTAAAMRSGLPTANCSIRPIR